MPKYFIIFGSATCSACDHAKEYLSKTSYKDTLVWYDLGGPGSSLEERSPQQNDNRMLLDRILRQKDLAPNTSMPRIFFRDGQDNLWFLQNGLADLISLLRRMYPWEQWLKD